MSSKVVWADTDIDDQGDDIKLLVKDDLSILKNIEKVNKNEVADSKQEVHLDNFEPIEDENGEVWNLVSYKNAKKDQSNNPWFRNKKNFGQGWRNNNHNKVLVNAREREDISRYITSREEKIHYRS